MATGCISHSLVRTHRVHVGVLLMVPAAHTRGVGRKGKEKGDDSCVILISEINMQDIKFRSTEKRWDTWCLNPVDLLTIVVIEHFQSHGFIENWPFMLSEILLY